MKPVSLILGTMTFGEQVFGEKAAEMIQCFLSAGYDELDTAYVYNEGQSEQLIGQALRTIPRESVKLSTKVNPRITGRLDAEAAYLQMQGSLERMGVTSVDTYYLHFPDANTPVDSVLEACQELHAQGKFRELGLSNFPAWMTAQVYYKCRANGWVLPTVYEGLYNPLSRRAEEELDDCLTELGLRFTAFNPLAGGILTDKYKSFDEAPAEGRFTYRPNYQGRYWKKSYFDAAAMIREEAAKHGLTIVEAVYRWMANHSMLKGDRGDALIIGASRLSQLEQNIAAFSGGPLPGALVDVFDRAWAVSRNDAPAYFRYYGR